MFGGGLESLSAPLLPAAVLVTDSCGLIQMANSAAAELLQLRIDRLVGKQLFAFVAPADREALRRALSNGDTADGALRTVATVQRRQGEPVGVEIALTSRHSGGAEEREATWVILEQRVAATDDDHVSHGMRVARAVAQIAQLGLTKEDPAVLGDIVHACQCAFSRPVGVSLALGDPGYPSHVATDSQLAQSVDGAQVIAGEGPSHTAWLGHVSVSSANLLQDDRWPRLRSQLGSSSVRSVLAVPIRVGDAPLGVLNVYSEDDSLADDTAEEGAGLLGATIAAVLRKADVLSDLESSTKQLQTALESRSTIDQAKGMVMAGRGCGPDEAFQALVEISSRTNLKLRDIAARMVEEASQGNKVLPDQRSDGGRSSVAD